MKGRLTIAAFLMVVAFGVLILAQLFNIPLAIVAIAALVYLAVGKNLSIALTALGLSLMASFAFGGSVLLIENIVLMVLPAFIMTIAIRLNLSAAVTVFLVLIPVVIALPVYFIIEGEADRYYNEVEPQIDQDFNWMVKELNIAKNLSLNDDGLEELRDTYRRSAKFLINYLPGLMMVNFITIAGVSYILLQYVFKKSGVYIRKLPRFVVWKMPESMLLIFGVSLLLVLISSGVIEDAGNNVALFCFAMFSVTGLSIMEFYMQKWQLNVFVKIVVYFGLVIFNIYAAVFLGILGLADSHFDIRRVKAARIG